MKLKLTSLLLATLFFSCQQTQQAPTQSPAKSFAAPHENIVPVVSAAPPTPQVTIQGDTTLKDGTRSLLLRVVIPPGTTPPKDTTPINPPIPPSDTSGWIAGIGINTMPWVPLEKLTMFSTVRLYVASGWIWRPGGLFVQPMYQAETEYAHGIDDYLYRAKALGIDVLPCVNQSPDWYNGYSQGIGSNDYPPIKPGADRTDPKSYADYAEFWYQFVCRYGSKVHPDADLRVDVTPRWNNDIRNVKKSGLNLIKAVEIGNEMDRWWDVGTPKYMNATEHAAMLIAVIDAIKRADPNMKIVMAGLTGLDLKYLKDMDAEFKRRGKQWPDVINCHYYTHEGNKYSVWPPKWWNSGATFPENDKGFPYISEVIKFCESINRPLWITEFGCDSKPPSWMHIDGSKYGMTDEQAQGRLLVETYKAYFTAGVERCYSFMAADEPGSNGGLWQTSGILRNKSNNWQEKPAWYAVKNYVNSLKTNKK